MEFHAEFYLCKQKSNKAEGGEEGLDAEVGEMTEDSYGIGTRYRGLNFPQPGMNGTSAPAITGLVRHLLTDAIAHAMGITDDLLGDSNEHHENKFNVNSVQAWVRLRMN